MNNKAIVGILLGLMIIPIGLLIISVPNIISSTNESDSQVKTYSLVDENNTEFTYYYVDTYICDNTYRFDNVWFTHKNYGRIAWKIYNSTHYELNFTMESYSRTPSGYILFFASNKFDANLTLSFSKKNYTLQEVGFDEGTMFHVAYITLDKIDQLNAMIDVECKNTHNSDLGDVSVFGQNQANIEIFDPSNIETTPPIFLLMTVFSILAIIALVIPIIIFVRRELNEF